jgi:hypothetical protein
MQERLKESLNLTSSKIDREAGIIHGVKLLGENSKNGRRYTEKARRESVSLYENAPVNVNHSDQPRKYEEHIATIRNVLAESEGTFGDLHLKQSHPLYEQIIEDAEKKTANIGMSHVVSGTTSRDGETVVVESITDVESVDLVANPATTTSLFEQADLNIDDPNNQDEDNTMSLDNVTEQDLRKERADLVEAIVKPLKDQLAEQEAEITKLKIEAEEKALIEAIDKMVLDAGLTLETVGEKLLEVCYSTEDLDKAKALIEERAETIKEAAKREEDKDPQSRPKDFTEGSEVPQDISTEDFAESITT